LLFVSKLLPIANIQGFLKKCITFSWVDWLRNGESLRNGPIYMEDPVYSSSEEYLLAIMNTGARTLKARVQSFGWPLD